MNNIIDLAERFFPKMVEIRRHIHQFPELSGNEVNTSKFICEQLDLLQIPYHSGIAGNGIVALLKGNGKGTNRTIALRADMDALPIQELNECEYRSKIENVMHACGHDFHCASLLGALMILNENRDNFSGCVKAIFQPSEERCEGGAPNMIDEGVLENPKVDKIYGLHAEAALNVSEVGFCSGNYMASTDELFLTVNGKGGHAALLNETNNPIFIAIKIINKLQEEVEKLFENDVSNDVSSLHVLNFGKFIAKGACNVIPDSVEIAGTLRLFDENKRKTIHELIETIPNEIALKMGGNCEVKIIHGYPVLHNDIKTTVLAEAVATNLLGTEFVKKLAPKTTAEDFAYFLQKVPGTFFRVGIANEEKGIVYKTHQNRFDIDENALKIAASMFAALVLCEEV